MERVNCHICHPDEPSADVLFNVPLSLWTSLFTACFQIFCIVLSNFFLCLRHKVILTFITKYAYKRLVYVFICTYTYTHTNAYIYFYIHIYLRYIYKSTRTQFDITTN